MYIQKKGVKTMSPRTGRPTDNPKKTMLPVRLSEKDINMLEFCVEKTGKTKAEIIRVGIEKIYTDLKNG